MHTQCPDGAKFTVVDCAKNMSQPVEVKHTGGEYPTAKVITGSKIQGPGTVKVKADSNSSRFSTSNFLVAFAVYPNK